MPLCSRRAWTTCQGPLDPSRLTTYPLQVATTTASSFHGFSISQDRKTAGVYHHDHPHTADDAALPVPVLSRQTPSYRPTFIPALTPVTHHVASQNPEDFLEPRRQAGYCAFDVRERHTDIANVFWQQRRTPQNEIHAQSDECCPARSQQPCGNALHLVLPIPQPGFTMCMHHAAVADQQSRLSVIDTTGNSARGIAALVVLRRQGLHECVRVGVCSTQLPLPTHGPGADSYDAVTLKSSSAVTAPVA